MAASRAARERLESDRRPRREFLLSIAAGAASLLLPSSLLAAVTRRRRTARPAPLSDRDRRIAKLGSAFAHTDPERAREIVRWVDSRLDPWQRALEPAQRARWVRRRLLDPYTRRREFERGDMVELDGWMLARSEAAVAIYLAGLAERTRSEA